VKPNNTPIIRARTLFQSAEIIPFGISGPIVIIFKSRVF
jgi:hypothetical protein